MTTILCHDNLLIRWWNSDERRAVAAAIAEYFERVVPQDARWDRFQQLGRRFRKQPFQDYIGGGLVSDLDVANHLFNEKRRKLTHIEEHNRWGTLTRPEAEEFFDLLNDFLTQYQAQLVNQKPDLFASMPSLPPEDQLEEIFHAGVEGILAGFLKD